MYKEKSEMLKYENDKEDVDVTIVIPHFNTPSSLKKLLDSIPKEEAIQIIVVDDKTVENKDEFDELRFDKDYGHVVFLDNETEKKGAGVCRNIGIKNALGKWLLFADADDYFVENFYLKIKKYLDSDKDVIFFFSTSTEVESNKKSYRHEKMNQIIQDYMTNPNKKNELILRYKLPVPWSKLISKEIIDKNVIYFDDTLVSNDVMFSLKLGYYMNLFEVTKEVIYCATTNTGSLTKTLSEDYFDTRLKVFIDRHTFLKERLSEKEFTSLDIDGKPFIVMAFQYKLGVRKILWVMGKYRENNVKLVENIWGLNPINVIRKIRMTLKKHKANKEHYVFK